MPERFEPPVIDLTRAPGAREAWDRPLRVVLAWAFVERLLVTNAFQISSRLRIAVLRRFGAEIGEHVIMRPGLRVKFPWKLVVGAHSWIGEDVWIHNQDRVVVGHDVVLSQGTFITTGSHAHRRDMALITRPVVVEDGAWVTSRCMLLGGVTVGRSALVTPNTVVKEDVPANAVYGAPTATVLGDRFSPSSDIVQS
ncbi:acetyltransferase [Nocardioides alkalitolerans]|uniref:acetyltransferase n=1 Tax=Nocardioides alkalitolerans TaxID=281714 RepID=UPI00048BA4DF|nr:acetyltransferase [Nocardioides alkalitolerans]